MQDDYSKDYKRDHSSPAVKPSGRSFINFVSAKQRVMNQTMASKTRRRAEDLSSLIELDTAHYDMFDLPPVREYELYMRNFGRSNTKQVSISSEHSPFLVSFHVEDNSDFDYTWVCFHSMVSVLLLKLFNKSSYCCEYFVFFKNVFCDISKYWYQGS